MTAPYLRIVADIRRRIAAGELRPGDRVPSTRQITREWGVAMATATKALTALRQEGLVRAVPGVGTVVAPAPEGRAPRAPAAPPDRARVVRTAVEIADAEGPGALSMRRLAAELGVPTMSLYRHVRDKDELILLMADAVYAEEAGPPIPETAGWRDRLEALARVEWERYRRHPWLIATVSFSRPALVPAGIARTERVVRAVSGLGLDANTVLHIATSVFAYVRGVAADLEPEQRARQDTGVTDEEWLEAEQAAFAETIFSGRFPALAEVYSRPGLDLDLDSLFTFGLARLLDGLEAYVARTGGTP
ncbi:DNA-binding transcriptional regulator YhcF (GntR family) [Thermocatellispora tengchongensis]|uniref:DNA-binding transcriptional regulator YhcF (GntR family) n=1 Tax=Thermocatellispora tengchongensis TaxID=1073253 RepID=A0A840P294_9ACTN|nr:TetR/AcrR family transcriptional regulator C-terminal domain-containing protein [Thermocatellispora tengchongensis]MBB5133109.1 DNA-binding transcriptional regulator YhcF (GntR family) [Thermocatellispora tengchongensis]